MVKNLLETKLAYSEVYKILSLLDDEYRNKVPKNVIDFFEEERMKEYEPEISLSIPLTEQKLRRKTIVLLSIINLDYWCESEEEKQKAREQFIINENEKRELEKKYDPNNLFKKKNEEINKFEEKNLELIEYKEENFIKKLLKKIMGLFKRNNS